MPRLFRKNNILPKQKQIASRPGPVLPPGGEGSPLDRLIALVYRKTLSIDSTVNL